MSEIIVIVILSVVVLLLLIGNIVQYNSAFGLRNEVREANESVAKKEVEVKKKIKSLEDEIKSTRKTREEILGVDPGDRGIMPDYRLTYGTKGQNDYLPFQVTYEVEILEVSAEKFKVKATGYTSNDKVANESKNRQGIIDFMKDKWIDRTSVEIIVDDAKRRGDKIDQILGDK